MNNKILLTGITSFVGSHLVDFLLSLKNYEIIGTKRHRSSMQNLEHLDLKNIIIEDGIDIESPSSIVYVLKKYQPSFIFHLAAQSFVPQSWRSPQEAIHANVLGTVNLFESILQTYDKKDYPRVLTAGSSEEYGMVYEYELPITESQPLRPLSPYGVSKVATTLTGIQYFKSYGIPVISIRAFNHTGARRGELFLDSSIAKQIAVGEKNNIDSIIIKHGNLDSKRDYTDVRDMVNAYWLAINNCESGIPYNISSGWCFSGNDILINFMSLANCRLKSELDPSRMRPSDVPVLHCEANFFKQETGWEPLYGINDTLLTVLKYWRQRV
jgi:GDP-4-dehydro-6-deoxy-D-mannose reductase